MIVVFAQDVGNKGAALPAPRTAPGFSKWLHQGLASGTLRFGAIQEVCHHGTAGLQGPQ